MDELESLVRLNLSGMVGSSLLRRIREQYELSRVERWLSTSDLVVWAPVALCVASLVLLTMSFLPP